MLTLLACAASSPSGSLNGGSMVHLSMASVVSSSSGVQGFRRAFGVSSQSSSSVRPDRRLVVSWALALLSLDVSPVLLFIVLLE